MIGNSKCSRELIFEIFLPERGAGRASALGVCRKFSKVKWLLDLLCIMPIALPFENLWHGAGRASTVGVCPKILDSQMPIRSTVYNGYSAAFWEFVAWCGKRVCKTISWVRMSLNLRYCGVLRLVGSLKLQVSFAKELYRRDDILQRRPMILRSLLIVATPYEDDRAAFLKCVPKTHSNETHSSETYSNETHCVLKIRSNETHSNETHYDETHYDRTHSDEMCFIGNVFHRNVFYRNVFQHNVFHWNVFR